MFKVLRMISVFMVSFTLISVQAATASALSTDHGELRVTTEEKVESIKVRQKGEIRKHIGGGDRVYAKISATVWTPNGMVKRFATGDRWNDDVFRPYTAVLEAGGVESTELCVDLRFRPDPCG